MLSLSHKRTTSALNSAVNLRRGLRCFFDDAMEHSRRILAPFGVSVNWGEAQVALAEPPGDQGSEPANAQVQPPETVAPPSLPRRELENASPDADEHAGQGCNGRTPPQEKIAEATHHSPVGAVRFAVHHDGLLRDEPRVPAGRQWVRPVRQTRVMLVKVPGDSHR